MSIKVDKIQIQIASKNEMSTKSAQLFRLRLSIQDD